jgi:hypothetical protein
LAFSGLRRRVDVDKVGVAVPFVCRDFPFPIDKIGIDPDHALRHRPRLGNGAQAEGGAKSIKLDGLLLDCLNVTP